MTMMMMIMIMIMMIMIMIMMMEIKSDVYCRTNGFHLRASCLNLHRNQGE